MSALFATAVDTGFQRGTNAAGTNRERIGGNAQPCRQFPPSLDFLTLRIPVVLDDQLALLRLQLLQTALEALIPLFLTGDVLVRSGSLDGYRRAVWTPLLVERDVPMVAPEVFEQHEARDDVAIASWWRDRDRAGLLECSADSIERFIGQLISRLAVPSLEVGDQPPTHRQIRFPLGIDAIVEPQEQSAERERGESPFFVHAVAWRHLRTALSNPGRHGNEK
jgi:hypothetical protein